MKIALCQIDTVQGDPNGNATRIAEVAHRAAEGGARLAVFPELALPGYIPFDLLFRRSFVEAVLEAERRLAERLPPSLDVLLGSIAPATSGPGKALFNVAVQMGGGAVRGRAAKSHLPTYDVFDEARWFRPARRRNPLEVDGRRLGVTVCEDIWGDQDTGLEVPRYEGDPPGELVREGAEIVLNLSASPFALGRPAYRETMVSRLARRLERPVVLVNLVGGNDETVYDGSSIAVDARGRILARLPAFREAVEIVDLGREGEDAAVEGSTPERDLEETHAALVLGVRDYARKSGFEHAVVGLSGGIDSALVAAIAAEALGPERVLGIAMPSRFSSAMSREDAEALARNLGIGFRTASIERSFSTAEEELRRLLGGDLGGLTLENLQPRLRGLYLMAVSNETGALLLSTGNKSELAVGYCTLYGDLCGGLAVISDVPKTTVYALARRYNARRGFAAIPERTITRPPSAELRADQKDTDTLPDYEILDEILERALVARQSIGEIVAAGFDESTIRDVIRRVRTNEYKRRQMAPGLRVSSKAFGIGRRMPLTAGRTWLEGAAEGDA